MSGKLQIKTEFTKEQANVVGWLMNATGLCAGCDQPLKDTDEKFPLGILPPPSILAQRIPSHFAVCAFCFGCASRINNLLKDLKRVSVSLKLHPDVSYRGRGFV